MPNTNSNWLVRHSPGRGNWRRRLFCFPYAGVGPQIFRQWPALLPADVDVVGIRLPGREQRFREPAIDDWRTVLDALADAVRPEADIAYAMFGHSLGARLAYELASRLEAEGRRSADLLIVSACRAPTTRPRRPPMHDLPRPALFDRLRTMQGVPEEVLADETIMALLEPTLRADLKLAETWNAFPGRISSPIAALCGKFDAIDTYDDMVNWRRHTSEGFSIHQFDAGHFFLHDEQAAVLETISSFFERHR